MQGAVGIPDQQQQTIEQYWDVYNEVWNTLQVMGFNQLPKPDGTFPHITPDDYANIEGDQYTTMMALVDVWFVYAKDAHSWIEGRVIGLQEELKDLERELKRAYRHQHAQMDKKDRPTETAIKEEAQSYPRCREIRKELVKLSGLQGTIKARIEGCERLSAGLSRQVTLRGQGIDLGGRVGGRRPPAPIRQ
jgi:hypothetical protein